MNNRNLVNSTLRDARYGLRLLRKDIGFAITAVLTLGVAIGVNTAVFSVVDHMLLRQLPYPEPERLGSVMRVSAETGQAYGASQDGRTWEAIRDSDADFQRAVYSDWTTGVNLVADRGAAYVKQQRVGAGYFAVLGVHPQIGREFSAREDLPDGPKVAVLSHALWQGQFDGDASVVGASIMLRGEPYTVVGVTPATFRNPANPDVWTPLRASTEGEGSGNNYGIVVRLRSDTSWPEAEGQLSAIGASLNEHRAESRRPTGLSVVPLQADAAAASRRPIQLLWAAVALVLLIACVNLSGLLLVRGARRRGEIATRMAIGGGRGAIVTQLMIESTVLALAGGVTGLLFARAALNVIVETGSEVLGLWRPVQLDARVLAATAVLSLGSAVVFGLAPAMLAGRTDLSAAMAAAGARAVAGTSGAARRILLVGQMALAVVLLLAAGLLLRSLLHLQTLEPGFDPANVYTVRVSLQDARYESRERVEAVLEEGVARVRAVAGVQAAAASLGLPYERLLNLPFRFPEGELEPANAITNLTYVTPGFFEALRLAVLGGRPLGRGDVHDSPAVIVVNDAFVQTYLTDGVPLGQRVNIAGEEREIVGVVSSAQQRPGWGDFGPLAPTPLVYMPLAQTSDSLVTLVHGWFTPAWIVRFSEGGAASLPQVKEAFASVDPLLPLARTESIAAVRDTTLAPQRLIAVLVSALGVAALFLAAIGIHAVVGSSVTERTREIGIRMALGATGGHALRAVALPGFVLAGIGAVLGGVLAYAATSFLQSFLWGVERFDPATFSAVAATFMVVAAVACLLPALRVLGLDPATTLRVE